MAAYPCSDDPSEIIEAVVGAGENAEKFDKFVNGGVTEEVQLGAGQPTPTLRNVVHLVKSAAATLDGSDVSGKVSDAANGGETLRTLAERFGDLVNVKDFGAVGDGVTNDSTAWTAWQTALQSGGIGYIPAGDYKLGSTVRHFSSGCFGNGNNWQMTGDNVPDDSSFMSNVTETGPIIQYHRDFSGIESWSPLIDVSFDSVSDRIEDWTVNGAGAQGIQVRGTIKGVGNSHPNGVRSLMLNELDGDGDCVAIWGRCHKSDPDGGTNDSDTCAIHASCEMSGAGGGICMASEHWAHCHKTQGTAGTNYDTFFDPGGIVCQHIINWGEAGMVQSSLLINTAYAHPYGAWSAININNNVCKYNGSTQYPANTCFIKSPNIHENACPEAFEFLGWCPKHVKMFGGYDYNIFANYLRKYNNLDDNDSIIAIIDQRGATSSESNTPRTGLLLQERAYSGIEHAPNVTIYENENPVNLPVTYFDLYHVRGDENVFYRAQNQNTTHHVFFSTDGSGVLGEVFNIFHSTVRPGRDNDQQLGDASKRWSTVFAGTGSINTSDERLKDNIQAPDEALMRAWGRVGFKVFQFKDAIERKGSEARLHVGVIAQEVQAAFEAEGLDAFRYGLLCKDEWAAVPQKIQRHWVEDAMEKRDDDGNVVEAARGHYEEFVEEPGRPAGDVYSIRYDEALALECAYQRWRLEQIENRLNGGQ